ncbi:MAG: replicative helicase loader/inhibitor [Anaerolineaceae bacterium]
MATNKEIISMIAVMSLAYPRYELKPGTAEVYSKILADIPSEVLEAAMKEIMANSPFFPSIAEWRAKAIELMLGTRNFPTAGEAWECAMREVARCGEYYRYSERPRLPAYDHPLIERAVDVIGYPRLVNSDNLVADRAHFFKIYDALVQRAKDDAQMLPESKQLSEKFRLKQLEWSHD